MNFFRKGRYEGATVLTRVLVSKTADAVVKEKVGRCDVDTLFCGLRRIWNHINVNLTVVVIFCWALIKCFGDLRRWEILLYIIL